MHILSFCSGPGSKCLDEPPRISLPGFTHKDFASKLPGVVFDADAQCRFIFGVEYRQCPYEKASC